MVAARMPKAKLIEKCQELMKGFNPSTMTLESYIQEQLGERTEGPVGTWVEA